MRRFLFTDKAITIAQTAFFYIRHLFIIFNNSCFTEYVSYVFQYCFMKKFYETWFRQTKFHSVCGPLHLVT